MELGDKVIEGKTKIVYKINNKPGTILIKSKDRITAGDGARANELIGKAAISTETNDSIFKILNNAGIQTHYINRHDDTSFVARHCDMIPIEWVVRRVATGSFLRRNPGVKEGFRFCPPKLEYFFKDDENHDPQWSKEQIVSANFNFSDRLIDEDDVGIIGKTTVAIFEILEKMWSSLDCSLIDMKIEFGVDKETGQILLADIIDSDSWRLWPSGDRRLMKDKQVYRDLSEVTPDALNTVKRNFQWVADELKKLKLEPKSQVAIFMGSPSDNGHADKIMSVLNELGVKCEKRVTSAHKGTEETMRLLSLYEGGGVPTVFIAIAGRSNGLGPVLSGNATWPVINCPPVTHEWAAQDLWSSLRLPSGLGCSTVISPDTAALQAAEILSLHDPLIWSKIRTRQLNTWISLKNADKKIRN